MATRRSSALVPLVLAFAGCAATPVMTPVQEAPAAPPEGKALVFFYRPSAKAMEHENYVYDGKRLVGVLQGEEATFAVCDPGGHDFASVSADGTSVVRADLAAGGIYDVQCLVALGRTTTNITLEPLVKGHVAREDLADWQQRCRLLERKGGGSVESKHRRDAAEAIQTYTTGSMVTRLKTLAADDVR